MQEFASLINTENIINLEKAASFLGVSTATVKNWVKCGHLQTQDEYKRYFFNLSEIENVKANIENGDLNKLNRRANKSMADRLFIPDEYLQNGIKVDDITKIINFVTGKNIDVSIALLLLSLNLLQKEKIISNITIQDLISQNLVFANKQIGEEIKAWLSEIETNKIKSEFAFLLSCAIPKQRDTLGFFINHYYLKEKNLKTARTIRQKILLMR
ncbi:MAG: hypothetical protein Q7S18_02255 [bacterium]|nr:hypothetical protein [bacterium]